MPTNVPLKKHSPGITSDGKIVMPDIAKTFSSPRAIFLLCAVILVAFNTRQLFNDVRHMAQRRHAMPYLFLGFKFSGIKPLLSHVEFAGYYSDKSLDVPQNALQFSHAQYTLAPVVLDFNNTDHDLIIFDCSSKKIAADKMQEIGAVPLAQNPFGIILAKKILPAPSHPRTKPHVRP